MERAAVSVTFGIDDCVGFVCSGTSPDVEKGHSMTVQVHLVAAAAAANKGMPPGHYLDDDGAEYAYATTDSGLLRILAASKSENDWRILTEFGPSAWLEVTGRRFTEDSGDLGSFIGTAKLKAPWHSVAG